MKRRLKMICGFPLKRIFCLFCVFHIKFLDNKKKHIVFSSDFVTTFTKTCERCFVFFYSTLISSFHDLKRMQFPKDLERGRCLFNVSRHSIRGDNLELKSRSRGGIGTRHQRAKLKLAASKK